MWEMLTTVLMREASSYTEPDPEEYVLVPEQYGAAGEGAEQCGEWPFLHDGNSTLAPAVVKRLINPNDSGYHSPSQLYHLSGHVMAIYCSAWFESIANSLPFSRSSQSALDLLDSAVN